MLKYKSSINNIKMPYKLAVTTASGVASKIFKTKETLTNYYKYILNNSKLGEPLEGLWRDEVKALIKQHPKASEKIGAGIQSIVVEKHFDTYTNQTAKHPHFHIYRVDGTDVDFSYYKCIRNMKSTNGKVSSLKKDSHEIELKKALRYEVKEYIYKFKKEYFGNCKTKKCQVTGKRIAISKAEVDHVSPLTFDQLVFNFLKKYDYKISAIEVVNVDGIHRKLKNNSIAVQWYDYHAANCELRIVAGWVNRTQEKSKGIPWSKVRA